MPLKPLSDLARRMLAKLGETPAQHQAQMLELQNKTYTRSHSSKREPSLHELNKRVEARLTSSEPSSDIARKLESTSLPEEEWIPEAYCIFLRVATCRSCGSVNRCLDMPLLFLRHRKKLTPRLDAFNGLPRLYLPVKVFVHKNLPRYKEVRPSTLVVCENCFQGVETCGGSEHLKQVNTSSSKPEVGEQLDTSSTFTVTLQELSSIREQGGSSGLSSLIRAGTVYEKFVTVEGGCADAPPLSSPTQEEGVVSHD